MPDFSRLQPFQKPQFVPSDFDPTNFSEIKKLYSLLAKRSLRTPVDIEHFLRDWCELGDVIGEAANRKYIAMTCQTDNKKAALAYKQLITKIIPKLKPWEQKLEKKYLSFPARKDLSFARYQIFDKQTETDIALYRKENIPLETKEKLLAQKYQTLIGTLTAPFDGKEQTLTQIAKTLEETDRTRREAAFRVVSETRYQKHQILDDLFDQLKALRIQMAKNAGFTNYRNYMFTRKYRFDYTPEDCYGFHHAVEKHVVPLLKKIQLKRKQQMKLPSLKPWDLAVDPLGRDPLRPFNDVAELINKCGEMFHRVDPQFGNQFTQMKQLGLLDLENRKGKAPGGYQEDLPLSRLPFIFMNAVGTDGDISTLRHEGGHAFNTFATKTEWLSPYRHPPHEFAEVASMSMELLTLPYLDIFYSPEDAKRARISQFEDVVSVLPWVATVDQFQHWIYLNPKHTQVERRNEWAKIFSRFSGEVDWSALEKFRETSWQRQLHIFEFPFYYIEYGIAQLGALQIWQNVKKDKAQAVKSYKKAFELGGSKPLPEIYQAANIKFQFDEAIIAPLINEVAQELEL